MLDKYHDEQQEFFEIASKIVLNNKISHAYLIETNNYSEYKDLAFSFAKFLYCDKHYSNFNSCGSCNKCHLIDLSIESDIKYIEPDGAVIKKEQLLKLQSEFKTKSLDGNNRIYIIDNVDRLTKSSANTILKFLEEPPENTIAILLANNRYNVISTILSRCITITLDNSKNTSDFVVDKNSLDFINFLEKKGLRAIINYSDFFDVKKENKDDLALILFNMKKIYEYILEDLIRNSDKKEEFHDIIELNSIRTISKKIILVEKQFKKIKSNNNLSLLLDKFIIDFSEVSKNV